MGGKYIFCFALLLSPIAIADEPADRAAIDRTITSLNERLADPGKGSPADLFTKDAKHTDIDGLVGLHHELIEMARKPWSEMSPPVIAINSTRFVTADVVLVDAAENQVYMGTHGIPLLFVMIRQSAEWRITSVHVTGNWPRFMPWMVNLGN